MKIRFKLNQAEAFRRGINLEKSMTSIEVKPSELKEDVRALIADHLVGIDVYQLRHGKPNVGEHVVALDPTIESLVQAIQDADAASAATDELEDAP